VHPLRHIIAAYDPDLPLERASTIPASWYTDPGVFDLERRTVFTRSWQFAGRVEQLSEAGRFVTCDIAGQPVVIVRGSDDVTRAFFNVCRHHAAAVVTDDEGCAKQLRARITAGPMH
jgi:choline monooxygenase